MSCGAENYSEVADRIKKVAEENERLKQQIVVISDTEKCGMYKLWNMLQHVSDYYYFGVDNQLNTDCDATSMTDIIDIHDLDSFLEGYKKWCDDNNLANFS